MEDSLFNQHTLQQAFKIPSWTPGTEVVVMCYKDDLEKVTKKVEELGYKVCDHIEPNTFFSCFISHGRFLMMKKSEHIHWSARRDSSLFAWFNRKVF